MCKRYRSCCGKGSSPLQLTDTSSPDTDASLAPTDMGNGSETGGEDGRGGLGEWDIMEWYALILPSAEFQNLLKSKKSALCSKTWLQGCFLEVC